MRLTSLAVHPVKSTAIRPLTSARVLPRGLADDRSWVVVDPEGTLISAREVRELFTITADTPVTEPGLPAELRLTAPGRPPIHVAVPEGAPVAVRVHANALTGIPAAEEASAWVSETLGRPGLRLVWCHDPAQRRLDPAYARPGDHTAYADGYPVTLASEASLRRLNDWIVADALERGEEPPGPLPMARFRPNLVIDGDEPFAEDDWTHVQVGEVRFRLAKPTSRCVMTTIDLPTLRTGKEPIRTLARHRQVDHQTLFAVHLVPEGPGTITVGDPVTAH